MSGQVSGWVLRHGPHPEHVDHDGNPYGNGRARRGRAVLLTIADAANADGKHSHPGMEAMIRGSLYAESTVKEALAWLIDECWIYVEEQGGGRGHATVYALPMVPRRKGQKLDPSTVDEVVALGEQERARNRPDSAAKGASSGRERGQKRQRALSLPTGATSDARATQRTGRSRRATNTLVPEDFTVTPEMRAWAAQNCPSVDIQFERDQFVDHWLSKGERRADWVRSWHTWMRNAERFTRERNTARTTGEVRYVDSVPGT